MKVSVNWLKQYLDFELPEINELAEIIGSKLGEIEEIESIGPKYDGIVIVKVLSVEKHPDADRLNVCRVDDGGVNKEVERGEDGLIQVVCGAPNVKADMMAAWLPPKATVPSSYGSENPLILEVREIRGVLSNGMLASPKELALGDTHEGLLELDVTINAERINKGEVTPLEAISNYLDRPDIKPGDDFRSAYDLDDTILTIENKMFTHRPDCFGILGIAREVAGILGHKFTSPDTYKNNLTFGGQETEKFELINEIPEMVPRLTARLYTGLMIGRSPVKLQSYLSRVGIRPINNIVDITNYYMFLTGQPLHAYDYDKVKELSSKEHPVIMARYPKEGETLTLLNGKTIKLKPKDIMIATDKELIGLGGIMGGGKTEVDSSTENIILECASFNMYQIRRTAMAHGLFTDAFTRFSKGQSPLQNTRVMNFASDEIICDTAGIPGFSIDLNSLSDELKQADSLYPPVNITPAQVNSLLGLNLESAGIIQLLSNVEFEVSENESGVSVKAPFWRTDIEIPEDVVEEVGRLYGYDKLPQVLPTRSIAPAQVNLLLKAKDIVRSKLSSAGANEVLTYSFVNGDLLKRAGQNPDNITGLVCFQAC
jgi:phenylalanyl-tRNA synthetase beta chain